MKKNIVYGFIFIIFLHIDSSDNYIDSSDNLIFYCFVFNLEYFITNNDFFDVIQKVSLSSSNEICLINFVLKKTLQKLYPVYNLDLEKYFSKKIGVGDCHFMSFLAIFFLKKNNILTDYLKKNKIRLFCLGGLGKELKIKTIVANEFFDEKILSTFLTEEVWESKISLQKLIGNNNLINRGLELLSLHSNYLEEDDLQKIGKVGGILEKLLAIFERNFFDENYKEDFRYAYTFVSIDHESEIKNYSKELKKKLSLYDNFSKKFNNQFTTKFKNALQEKIKELNQLISFLENIHFVANKKELECCLLKISQDSLSNRILEKELSLSNKKYDCYSFKIIDPLEEIFEKILINPLLLPNNLILKKQYIFNYSLMPLQIFNALNLSEEAKKNFNENRVFGIGIESMLANFFEFINLLEANLYHMAELPTIKDIFPFAYDRFNQRFENSRMPLFIVNENLKDQIEKHINEGKCNILNTQKNNNIGNEKDIFIKNYILNNGNIFSYLKFLKHNIIYVGKTNFKELLQNLPKNYFYESSSLVKRAKSI